jgi:hypothetical protein
VTGEIMPTVRADPDVASIPRRTLAGTVDGVLWILVFVGGGVAVAWRRGSSGDSSMPQGRTVNAFGWALRAAALLLRDQRTPGQRLLGIRRSEQSAEVGRRIEELRAAHPGDTELIQEETIAIYRETGVKLRPDAAEGRRHRVARAAHRAALSTAPDDRRPAVGHGDRQGAAAMSRRLLVAVVVCLLGLAAPALARAFGTISGTASDASGDPLSGVCVTALPQQGNQIPVNAETGVDGTYSIDVLAGTYEVQFQGCSTNADFAEQWYPGQPTQQTGEPLVVSDGQTIPDVDARLQPGGQIIVQAVDADTGAPVDGDGIELDTPGSTESDPLDVTFSAAAASYGRGPVAFTGLSTGTYLLQVEGGLENGRAESWYPNVPDPGHSELIQVTGGQTTTLTQPLSVFHGGAINGTVTGSGRALADASVQVDMTEPDGSVYFGGEASTEPNGQYTASAIAPGTWTINATAGNRRVPQARTAAVTENGDSVLDFSLARGRDTLAPHVLSDIHRLIHRLRIVRRGRTLTITGLISDRQRVRGNVTVSFGRLLPGRHTLTLGRFTVVGNHFRVRVALPRHRELLNPRLFIHIASDGRFKRGVAERRLPHR